MRQAHTEQGSATDEKVRDMSEYGPTVSNYRRVNGIAGQYSVTVDVTYPDPDESHTATFVGNVSGGPIVAVSPSGQQIFVSSAVLDRIGHTLDESWVRRFYGADE